jgi:hypothetical protein
VIGAAVHLVSEFATSESHAHEQGETMTYNRMEAKPITGEHGRFCGDAKAPLELVASFTNHSNLL